jgi:membrane fusion protein (multidrug efflux system)
MKFHLPAVSLRIACVLPLMMLAACSGGSDDAKRGAPSVGFVVASSGPVPITTSLSGRVVAYESSEVRPQVSGVIQRRLFTEGGTVRAGEPLFQIDPSLYQASVNQAAANLTAAQATAEAASARADRLKPLAEMEAVAKQDYTDALAQAREARASVAQNKASLDTARINLRFATVPAPISGHIGRSLFTVGALVSANQTQPLAVIQRLDPVYVDMQQSSSELLSLQRALAAGGVTQGSTQVHLKLEDGSDYPYTGTVKFSEVTVNEATNTVTLRASFANPHGGLLPGMFVQTVFDQAVDPSAYLVPQQAMQRDFGGDAFVYLVGKDNKVERRKVTAGRTAGADWVVTSGLNSGDKIITQGINNLRHGMAVRPVPADTPQKVGTPAAGQSSGKTG